MHYVSVHTTEGFKKLRGGLNQKINLWDGKGYHNVHAHTTGTGETAAQQRCVLSIESSM
jgi:hypothetical protein